MAKKILIIDDDENVLEIMQEALSYDGIESIISQVSDGYATTIRQQNIGLVIIDYLLEGINGGEICHEIKNSREFGHIPVIIYSAYPRVLQSLGSYGCDLFIAKPFDLYDMISQSCRLLNNPPRSFTQYSYDTELRNKQSYLAGEHSYRPAK